MKPENCKIFVNCELQECYNCRGSEFLKCENAGLAFDCGGKSGKRIKDQGFNRSNKDQQLKDQAFSITISPRISLEPLILPRAVEALILEPSSSG